MKNQNKILQQIASIYPIYMVLICFFPLFVGFIIDSDLSSSREFLITLVWIPLFTIPAILIKKDFFYKLINTLYFVIGFISLIHWILLKSPISLTSLLVISNTNYQESIEFLNLKVSYELLILLPYLFIYILALRNKYMSFQISVKSYLVYFVLLFSIAFIAENAMHSRLVRKGIPHFAKVAVQFYQKINLFREASISNEFNKIDAISLSETNTTFVLILGESCNRNHMSLYSYNKKTSPKLSANKNIIAYNNVVSPYSNTLNSVLTILSESNLDNGIEITQGIDLIDVFHAAGFKTYWLSNQSPIGMWDNQVTVFANKSDYKKFVNISSSSSFEATYTSSFDSKLFKPFSNVLNENEAKKLIIIHLMGSHSSYSKRYPSEYDIFSGSDSKSQLIAEYDNSILYNDFIVDTFLQMLKAKSSVDSNRVYSAIYLSDHGENVYDENNNVGHDYSKVLPKSNVEIPFIVWLSDSYKNLNNQISQIVVENKHTPFVSDDLFHSVIDLNFISCSVFNKKRSVFNSSFNESRKRILEDKSDYDKN